MILEGGYFEYFGGVIDLNRMMLMDIFDEIFIFIFKFRALEHFRSSS